MRALRRLVRLTCLSCRQFQKEQGDDRLEGEELPGRGIVEDILEQLEKDELDTEHLSEVSREEEEEKSLRKSGTESQLSLWVDGSWRLSVQTPKSKTDLRLRCAILANEWEFVKLKKTLKKSAADLSL